MIKQVIEILTEKELSDLTKQDIKILKLFCIRFAKGENKEVLIELKKVIEMWERENGRN